MREFADIDAFLKHLTQVASVVPAIEHAAVLGAATIVKAEAKREIGHYQPAAGEFAAWAQLADATKADRRRQGFEENAPLYRTGELANSIQAVAVDNDAAVGSDDPVAEHLEFGTAKIPPRSFLGRAAFVKGEDAARAIGEAFVVGLLTGEPHADQHLNHQTAGE